MWNVEFSLPQLRDLSLSLSSGTVAFPPFTLHYQLPLASWARPTTGRELLLILRCFSNPPFSRTAIHLDMIDSRNARR
jgi:hypothetical protein